MGTNFLTKAESINYGALGSFQLERNIPAQHFWNRVTTEQTGGDIKSVIRRNWVVIPGRRRERAVAYWPLGMIVAFIGMRLNPDLDILI